MLFCYFLIVNRNLIITNYCYLLFPFIIIYYFLFIIHHLLFSSLINFIKNFEYINIMPTIITVHLFTPKLNQTAICWCYRNEKQKTAIIITIISFLSIEENDRC